MWHCALLLLIQSAENQCCSANRSLSECTFNLIFTSPVFPCRLFDAHYKVEGNMFNIARMHLGLYSSEHA